MREVFWQPTAENELADLWLACDSELRAPRNAYLAFLDRELSRDPENLGENRERNRRIHFDSAFAAVFAIVPATGRVWVLNIYRFNT